MRWCWGGVCTISYLDSYYGSLSYFVLRSCKLGHGTHSESGVASIFVVDEGLRVSGLRLRLLSIPSWRKFHAELESAMVKLKRAKRGRGARLSQMHHETLEAQTSRLRGSVGPTP